MLCSCALGGPARLMVCAFVSSFSSPLSYSLRRGGFTNWKCCCQKPVADSFVGSQVVFAREHGLRVYRFSRGDRCAVPTPFVFGFGRRTYTPALSGILGKLSHPCLVQCLGYGMRPNALGGELFLALAAELGGDLSKLVIASMLGPSQYDDADVIRWLHDVACGLAYLHTRRPNLVVHRDLKLENVLLSDTGSAKITDFGLVKIVVKKALPGGGEVTEGGTYACSGGAGAIKYSALRGLVLHVFAVLTRGHSGAREPVGPKAARDNRPILVQHRGVGAAVAAHAAVRPHAAPEAGRVGAARSLHRPRLGDGRRAARPAARAAAGVAGGAAGAHRRVLGRDALEAPPRREHRGAPRADAAAAPVHLPATDEAGGGGGGGARGRGRRRRWVLRPPVRYREAGRMSRASGRARARVARAFLDFFQEGFLVGPLRGEFWLIEPVAQVAATSTRQRYAHVGTGAAYNTLVWRMHRARKLTRSRAL